MLDLTKYNNALPSAIVVEGVAYPVKTWFKHWMRFMQICESGQPEEFNFDFLFVDKDKIPENKEAAFIALKDFATPKALLPRPSGKNPDQKIVDYAVDANLIYSAFMQMYHIDLIDDENLHWHKFLALFEGLQGTKMNTVMEARMYDESDKTSYEEYKRQSRESWSLEGLEKISETEEAIERFNEAFD